VQPPAPMFASLTMGRSHACAIDVDGQLYCWGANDVGQIGDGTTSFAIPRPTRVGLTTTAVAAAGSMTCALAAGVAYCWGDNAQGQLGQPVGGQLSTPTPVAGG